MLYLFEDFALDPDRRELRRGDAIIAIQPLVFDLLEYLLVSRDRVVSKDDILGAVWGGRNVSESALTTRINAARAAIGDNGDQQRLIRTLPRKGIRFVGQVREQARPVVESTTAPAGVDTGTPEQTAARRDITPAERRQLTIASCELLLEAVTARMDPEDLREIIQNYEGCVADLTRRYAGIVAYSHGNTAVIYLVIPKRTKTTLSVQFGRRLS
jgi:DNA-binding winged helix-turn-helix (wHTH) protein